MVEDLYAVDESTSAVYKELERTDDPRRVTRIAALLKDEKVERDDVLPEHTPSFSLFPTAKSSTLFKQFTLFGENAWIDVTSAICFAECLTSYFYPNMKET